MDFISNLKVFLFGDACFGNVYVYVPDDINHALKNYMATKKNLIFIYFNLQTSELEKAEEFYGQFTKSEYKQVPLMDRSVTFMHDIVVTKEGVR